MTHLSHEIRELNTAELDAVTGTGTTMVGINEQVHEQVAHFLAVHERTSVVDGFEHIARPTKK